MSTLLLLIALAVLWAVFLVVVGTLLFLPTAIFAAVALGSTVAVSRWSKPIAGALCLVFVTGPFLAWANVRQSYRLETTVIAQRIGNAERLGRMGDAPDAILVRDYPFPESDFSRPGCFPKLFIRSGERAFQWEPTHGFSKSAALPTRYLEFILDDDARSPFGDRSRTGRRGPHELWLVEGANRKLVDVLMIEDDGHSFVPPLSPYLWRMIPTHLKNEELRPKLLHFLNRNTGQCASTLG